MTQSAEMVQASDLKLASPPLQFLPAKPTIKSQVPPLPFLLLPPDRPWGLPQGALPGMGSPLLLGTVSNEPSS